jgi:hypothetical protein
MRSRVDGGTKVAVLETTMRSPRSIPRSMSFRCTEGASYHDHPAVRRPRADQRQPCRRGGRQRYHRRASFNPLSPGKRIAWPGSSSSASPWFLLAADRSAGGTRANVSEDVVVGWKGGRSYDQRPREDLTRQDPDNGNAVRWDFALHPLHMWLTGHRKHNVLGTDRNYNAENQRVGNASLMGGLCQQILQSVRLSGRGASGWAAHSCTCHPGISPRNGKRGPLLTTRHKVWLGLFRNGRMTLARNKTIFL